ncbi:MAG: hypothetical protein M1579_00680 [Gammaproteobacteria bacterium]|nr:hypothetical protein [Gammaproteobacteria bacterium]
MDKILLVTFLSSLAGFITAVISIVKLVNEKESKITDYRQEWTKSLRESLSNLISNLNNHPHLLGFLSLSVSEVKILEDNSNEADIKDKIIHKRKQIEEIKSELRESRKNIYDAYALTQLHFKPNDISFNRIEQKFDLLVVQITSPLESASSDDIQKYRASIHALTKDIADYSRDILKTEWETVKNGEKTYKQTKKWSQYASIVLLFVILSIGVHSAFSFWKKGIEEEAINNAKSTQVVK